MKTTPILTIVPRELNMVFNATRYDMILTRVRLLIACLERHNIGDVITEKVLLSYRSKS